MAIIIEKAKNVGNTFNGIIATAFPGVESKQIKVDPFMQCGNCGTIEVAGVAWDWFNRADRFEFMVAE